MIEMSESVKSCLDNVMSVTCLSPAKSRVQVFPSASVCFWSIEMTITVKFMFFFMISVILIILVYYRTSRETPVLSPPGLSRRAPDVLILGVKKCGTITLGGTSYTHSEVIPSDCADTFLRYHPNLAVRGEIKFFVFDDLYGQELYLSKLYSELH